MELQEIMSGPAQTVDIDDKVPTAAAKMLDRSVGALPVMDQDRIAGIITDRDMVVRGLAKQGDLSAVPVRQIMSADVACLSPRDQLSRALEIMNQKQLRRVIVIDDDKQPIGIVSLDDVAFDHRLAGACLDILQGTAANS